MNRRKRWSNKRVIMLVLLVIGLVGVVGYGSSWINERSPLTVEEVHEQYLEALRTGDRRILLALTADSPLKEAVVDHRLENIRGEMQPTNRRTGGNLSQVEVINVEDDGVGKRGYSRWTYTHAVICHEVPLVQTEQGWRVTDWFTSPACPE